MISLSLYRSQRSVCLCWDLATCLVFSLLLLTAATAIPVKDCPDYVDANGAHVQNCSGKEMSMLPEKLSTKAEVLDFSRNMFTVLPNITETDECKVASSTNDSTSHCRHTISFSRNHINNVPADALHSLKCLRNLDLSFNEIKADAFNTFLNWEGVYYLQRLLLNNNPLGSLPPHIITRPLLPNLIELDISHCGLDDISPNSVDDFPEMKILNLSFNKLKTIHYATFKGLTQLEHLDLRENQLTSFPEDIFGDLINLKVLLLSDNKIQSFHEKAFYKDSSLQVLDLRNNRLDSVPYTALDKVTKLQTLDLSQNPIGKVNRDSIQSNVQSLVLDYMPDLTELGPSALASFPAIVSLSICGNKALETIDRNFLGNNLSLLKQVRLENNKLSTLDYDTLPWKQLEELRLGGNPWVCDNALEWMIRAPCITSGATCAWPLMLKGHDIKTLNPDDLMRDYSLQSATAVILLFVFLPVFGMCAILVWRRRRFFTCVKTTLKGQYVTLFTREMDDEGEKRVAIILKTDTNRLKAVSNGDADDSIPFIRLQDIKEEIEADDV